MLQQFDNNVDKAVQAFMDGEYNVPFSLMQEGFNHMPKYLLSLVAQDVFCGSSEIWRVTVVNYNTIDPPVLHLCFFTVQVWHGFSSVLPDCHFWSHSHCRPVFLFCMLFKVICEEIIHYWRYSNEEQFGIVPKHITRPLNPWIWCIHWHSNLNLNFANSLDIYNVWTKTPLKVRAI